MTGTDLVDRGLGCDAQPQDGERCYLEPVQRERQLLLISHGLDVMLTSQHAAIANSKLHKATKEDRFWNGLIAHSWFGDAYRAIKAHPNASEITAGDDVALFGRPEQVVTDAR